MNAVLKVFQLAEEMDASQQNFLQILQYGKEQYCKGTAGARFEYLWPQSWQSAIKMLEDQGYQDATDYFVCLSNDHFCSCDIFSGLKSACRICESPASSCIKYSASSCIKYSYLPLKHNVGMSLFCFFLTYFSFQQFFYFQPIFLNILLEIHVFCSMVTNMHVARYCNLHTYK